MSEITTMLTYMVFMYSYSEICLEEIAAEMSYLGKNTSMNIIN